MPFFKLRKVTGTGKSVNSRRLTNNLRIPERKALRCLTIDKGLLFNYHVQLLFNKASSKLTGRSIKSVLGRKRRWMLLSILCTWMKKREWYIWVIFVWFEWGIYNNIFCEIQGVSKRCPPHPGPKWLNPG